MNKPTKEQTKEVWEWCGLSEEYWDGEWFWVEPNEEGSFRYKNRTTHDELPIDLNNLWKYAIPQLCKEHRNWRSLLHDWVEELTGDYEKDALSLYWLLAQTI